MQQKPQVESLANNQLKHNGLPDRMFAVHTLFLFLLFFICAYLMFFYQTPGICDDVSATPRPMMPVDNVRCLHNHPLLRTSTLAAFAAECASAYV